MRRFAAVLAVLLLLLMARTPPQFNGDFLEYSVTAIAFAAHATPDIRPADAAEAAALAPSHAAYFHELSAGMAAAKVTPVPGFNISRDGKFYSIHSWGYSALAAPAFALFKALGVNPLKAFQLLNLGMVFVLGLCLYRLFESAWRAAFALLLFALCGGALYWNWCSPECMSAAALLSSMILFCHRAPLRAGLLAGLAAMQNPSIVLLAPFVPLLMAAFHWRAGEHWRSALAATASWRLAAGLCLLCALFALPFALSYWKFGVPSLIALYSTSRQLVTPNRLHSLLFDLNHGMVVGVPALMALGGAWLLRRRGAPLAAVALALVLAMAFPALSAYNWNSGAAGMMRYAFWCAMPLLFLLLARLRCAPHWPWKLAGTVVLAQLLATWHGRSYDYIELSPVADFVLRKAPGWYNPDPELFADRVLHGEAVRGPDTVVQYRPKVWRAPTKTLFHRAHPDIGAVLCAGQGGALAPGAAIVEVDGGWRYLNGPVACAGAPQP